MASTADSAPTTSADTKQGETSDTKWNFMEKMSAPQTQVAALQNRSPLQKKCSLSVVADVPANQLHPAALKAMAETVGYPRSLVGSQPCSAKQAAATLSTHAQPAKLRWALSNRSLPNTGSIEARCQRLFEYEIKQANNDGEEASEEDDDENEEEEDVDADSKAVKAAKAMKKSSGRNGTAMKCLSMKKLRRS